MRVEIPFAWKGTRYVPSGRMERTYRDSHAIDIVEVSGDAAPIALRWRGAKPLSLDYGGPPVPVEARAYEGGLYEPIRHRPLDRGGEGHDYLVQATTPEQLVAATTDDTANASAHAVLNMRTFFEEDFITSAWQVRLAPPKKATYERENRTELVARIDRLAARLLVVDGMLHARISEPVLKASPKDGAVQILRSEGDAPYPERGRCYRLDETEAAALHVAEVAGISAKDVALPDFELLRPEALAYAPADTAILATGHVLRETAGKALRELPLEGIELYCDLVETRYKAGAADPEMTERVRRLAEILVASCPDYAQPAREALYVVETRSDGQALSALLP